MRDYALDLFKADDGKKVFYMYILFFSSLIGLDKIEKELGHIIFHAGTAVKEGKVVTSGGRVLAVVATDTDLATAARQAQLGATAVQYDGVFFRKDIAHKAIRG